MPDPSCTTCRFAEPIAGGDDGEPRTECRRFPPQVFALDGEAAQTWPNTYPDGWCGEYQPSATWGEA